MLLHQNHTFHIVEKRPWPLIASLIRFRLVSRLLIIFHSLSFKELSLTLLFLLIISYQWWRDINRESMYQGLHTFKVQINIRLGIILFIVSEIIFFFSFFWRFFHRRINPVIELGDIWPPFNIKVFNPFQIPLLNTAILLSSGISVTWAHHSIINNNYRQAIKGLILTVVLGIYFTLLQIIEYIESSFTIADSVYGSTFFVATGFHGLHVIIGTIFILIGLIRHIIGFFSNNHHFGIEAAIWYWHFVDVVWLFLFVSIYWWGY